MKVLILSASAGGGHNRAANALKDYITKRNKDSEVVIIDAIAQASKFINFFVTTGYKNVALFAPGMYGTMYRNANKESKNPTSEVMEAAVLKLTMGIYDTIVEINPDIIICTHPFANNMVGNIKKTRGLKIPHICVITDFMPHRAYLNDNVDAFVCATDETARVLTNKFNVDESKVYATGMPVYERFYKNDPERDKKTYKQLGFSSDKLTILVMAGSFGVTDILKIYENLVDIDLDYQIIVITGKNRRLYNAFAKMLNGNLKTFYTYQAPKWIDKLSDHNPIKILYDQSGDYKNQRIKKYKKKSSGTKPTKLFYYIDNVDDYMHISDLIITKPGGLTTSESLACELPLAIFQAFPGQEEENANYLVEKGIAVMLKNGKQGAKQIEHILKYPKILMTMKENCRGVSKGDACGNIYNIMIKLLDEKKNK